MCIEYFVGGMLVGLGNQRQQWTSAVEPQPAPPCISTYPATGQLLHTVVSFFSLSPCRVHVYPCSTTDQVFQLELWKKDTGRCTFYSFRHRHLCSPTVVPAQADDFKYAFLKMPKIFSAFCCFCQKSTGCPAIFAHRVCVSTKCDLGLSLMSTSGEHGFKNEHLRFADESEIVNFGGVHRRLWTSRHQLKKQVYF